MGAGEEIIGQLALGLDLFRVALPAGVLFHGHMQKADVVEDGGVLVVVIIGLVVEGDGLGKIAGLVGFEDEEKAQRGIDQRGLVVRRRALDGGDGVVEFAQPPQADGVVVAQVKAVFLGKPRFVMHAQVDLLGLFILAAAHEQHAVGHQHAHAVEAGFVCLGVVFERLVQLGLSFLFLARLDQFVAIHMAAVGVVAGLHGRIAAKNAHGQFPPLDNLRSSRSRRWMMASRSGPSHIARAIFV